LDFFDYYPPADSKYTEVEGIGITSKDNSDSKVAVSKIKIGVEIGLHELIEREIKFIFERTKLTKESTNNKEKLQASNSGIRGAASNSGISGAASNSGYRGAASNSGYRGAAFTIGSYSSAETKKENSFAVALGYQNKASGFLGSWLVLAEWDEDGKVVKNVETVKVDGKNIKADTWYKLENKKFIEVK
jgi:hypothetical protein